MSNRVRRQSLPIAMSAFCLFCLAVVCFVIPVSVIASEDGDYLRALTLEEQKVERKSISNDGVTDAQSASKKVTTVDSGEGFNSGLSMDAFEFELQERYTGSAVFYRKLPRRSQEEVYQDYRQGASISEVRKKIMNRFLHR